MEPAATSGPERGWEDRDPSKIAVEGNRPNDDADAGGKSDNEDKPEVKQNHKPSVLAKIWKKMDLDLPTVLIMMK